MDLKKTLSIISSAQKKKASSFTSKVRELEEESKGKFIAFVDDGEHSYDVGIQLDPKELLFISSNCDCSSKAKFCPHQVAVMTAILSDSQIDATSAVIKKIRKVKKSKVELLVETYDPDKVMIWLVKELEQDGELLLRFQNEFVNSASIVTSEDMEMQFKASIKAVIGSRRTIQLSELPKILKLLSPLQDRVIDQFAVDIYRPEVYPMFRTMFSHFTKLGKYLAKHTTRLNTYTSKKRDIINATIAQFDRDRCEQLIALVIDQKESEIIGLQFLIDVLNHSAPKLSSEITKKSFIAILEIMDSGYFVEEKRYVQLVEAGKELPYFSEMIQDFPMRYYFNRYNLFVLELALEAGLHEYIDKNVNRIVSQYNFYYAEPYYNIYKNSLSKQGKEDQVVIIDKIIFSAAPSFKSFMNIYNKIDLEEERKNFWNKANMIPLSRNAENYVDRLELKMGLRCIVGDYETVISMIENVLTFRKSLPFVRVLTAYSKESYLEKVWKALSYTWGVEQEDYDNFEEIIRDYYNKEELYNASQSLQRNATLDPLLEKRLGVER